MSDPPLSGPIVQFLVIAGRFRCEAALCGRQIPGEPYNIGDRNE
jgi:hypothetical protein